jgi:hypothetical protein
MFTYFIYLIAGLFGGILSAVLIPSFLFTDMNQFISTLILDPFNFVLGMIFFFIGFIANATLFRNSIELSYAKMKNANISIGEIILSSFYIGSFLLTFIINFSVAVCFLIFSILYGMISLNLRRYLQYERKREEV